MSFRLCSRAPRTISWSATVFFPSGRRTGTTPARAGAIEPNDWHRHRHSLALWRLVEHEYAYSVVLATEYAYLRRTERGSGQTPIHGVPPRTREQRIAPAERP